MVGYFSVRPLRTLLISMARRLRAGSSELRIATPKHMTPVMIKSTVGHSKWKGISVKRLNCSVSETLIKTPVVVVVVVHTKHGLAPQPMVHRHKTPTNGGAQNEGRHDHHEGFVDIHTQHLAHVQAQGSQHAKLA